MYKTIYTVPFVSIDGAKYVVRILEDGATGIPMELVGGTPPFVVDINDEDYLYTPTRLNGATLKLVGSDYLQTLFSTQYQKYKVNLLKNGIVVWTGFITPEVYSQDYDNTIFELELECVSALSTLEYIDFKETGNTITLLELIKKCITESKGDFNAIYIPNAYTEPLSNLILSCSNFIDEDGTAMKLKDVIEEVCKFLGWTITEHEGSVYFIDIDYIKAGQTSYTKYNLSFNGINTTLSDTISIQNIQSKGSGNNLSILGGYNKVVVIDSDYEIKTEQLYPKFEPKNIKSPFYNETKGDGSQIYRKDYYESENFIVYQYTRSGNVFVRNKVEDLIKRNAGAEMIKRTNWDNNDRPNSLNWETVIQIKLFDAKDTSLLMDSFTDTAFEMIRTKMSSPSLPFSNDTVLCVSFQIQYSDKPDGFVLKDKTNDDDIVDKGDVNGWYVPISLRCGNYWYNGANWQLSQTYFKVYTDLKSKKQHFTFDWLNAKNTNDWLNELPDLDGTLIDMDRTIIGDLEMIVFCPKQMQDRYLHRYVFLKDIKINAQKRGYNSDNEKKDTKYENVVNEAYINALDDIDLKITSKNESELSFSKVVYNDSILDKLNHIIYSSSEKPEELLIKRIVTQYQQPKVKLSQTIEPKVLPYSIITDSFLPNRKFIFTGGSLNYEDNSINCNMIEIH